MSKKSDNFIEAKVLKEVRTFISSSDVPVTFGDVFVHVSQVLPVGAYSSEEVKLAAYRMIDDGEATLNTEWAIITSAKKLKREKAGKQNKTPSVA